MLRTEYRDFHLPSCSPVRSWSHRPHIRTTGADTAQQATQKTEVARVKQSIESLNVLRNRLSLEAP
jgi:hypothetical protein